jgi:hypothetical protein
MLLTFKIKGLSFGPKSLLALQEKSIFQYKKLSSGSNEITI